MINLINYALLAEQKKYGYFNKINEALAQSPENLKLVLSGADGGAYKNQWNQLMKSIKKSKEQNNQEQNEPFHIYKVMILDNDGVDMVLLHYKLDATNGLDISDVTVATPGDAGYFVAERDKDKISGSSKSTDTLTKSDSTNIKKYTDDDLRPIVKELVDCLDFPVTSANVERVKEILTDYDFPNYAGYADDDKILVPAIGRIMTIYSRNENIVGGDLKDDVDSIGTNFLSDNTPKVIGQIKVILAKYKKQ